LLGTPDVQSQFPNHRRKPWQAVPGTDTWGPVLNLVHLVAFSPDQVDHVSIWGGEHGSDPGQRAVSDQRTESVRADWKVSVAVFHSSQRNCPAARRSEGQATGGDLRYRQNAMFPGGTPVPVVLDSPQVLR